MADTRGIWWRMLTQAAVGLALATPQAALAAPPEGPELAAWLARTTDLKSSQIALVGDDSVYSLEILGAPLPTGEILALVRTEPRADDWGASHGFWSWDANLLIDCPRRRLQVVRSATYPQRNRVGKPAPEPQDYAALTPLRQEPAAKLIAAACDADFAWPLRDVSPTQVASVGDPPGSAVIAMPTEPPPRLSAARVDVVLAPRGWALQVAQGPSEEGARRAAAAARKTLGPEAKSMTGWTEASLSGEVQAYAGLLGAFPTHVAAFAACETLKQAKQDCLVRRGAPEPAKPRPVVAQAADKPTAPAAPTEVAQAAPEPVAPSATSPANATFAVQVARGPSEEGARRALAKARKTLGALPQPVRDAMPTSRIPGDHIRYDARLEGFQTAEAAGEACRKLSSAGQDCFALEVSQAASPADQGPG